MKHVAVMLAQRLGIGLFSLLVVSLFIALGVELLGELLGRGVVGAVEGLHGQRRDRDGRDREDRDEPPAPAGEGAAGDEVTEPAHRTRLAAPARRPLTRRGRWPPG